MATVQHNRTTAVLILQIVVSHDTKCVIKGQFSQRESHNNYGIIFACSTWFLDIRKSTILFNFKIFYNIWYKFNLQALPGFIL